MSSSVVDSLDAPEDSEELAGGGSMDASAYFTTQLTPNIADCTNQIAQTFQAWVKRKKFQTPLSDPRPGDLVIHATAPELGGIIELKYVVTRSPQGRRARVTLWFYSNDASQHELTRIQAFLKKHEIASLQDEIIAALKCGQNP